MSVTLSFEPKYHSQVQYGERAGCWSAILITDASVSRRNRAFAVVAERARIIMEGGRVVSARMSGRLALV